MAAEQFHSLGGFSSGIPPVQVIDANGNVVTNVLTSGNVTANTVFATFYRYANGQPITVEAGGQNSQLQFNNNGEFGGIPNVTWDGNKLTLDVSSLGLLGGDNGYFLQTDGTGNLTWSPGGGSGANGNPGGANTQVQFNKEGEFGGDAGFTYDDVTNTLNVEFITVDTVTGNLTGTATLANVANTVSQNAQPNITSVGTLTTLNVSGSADIVSIDANSLSANLVQTTDLAANGQSNIDNLNTDQANIANLFVSANASIQGIMFAPIVSVSNTVTSLNSTVTGNSNVSGNLNTTGSVNLENSSLVNLGSVSNVKISGGVNGYVLTTDGSGNLSWSAGGQGGNGVPGGTNTQVQFNDDGSFAGDPFFTFNSENKNVAISGNLIANSITMGSGVYQFSRSNVFFATTTATSNTALISLDADEVSSVDFTVIATDNIARNRQVSKLSAVMYDANVNYNEYSTLYVNDLVGDFSIGYESGNAIAGPTVTLFVEPESVNTTTYKIQITVYDE